MPVNFSRDVPLLVFNFLAALAIISSNKVFFLSACIYL